MERFHKRDGIILICLAVRAVNIELASSLDTGSYINALWWYTAKNVVQRYIARQGEETVPDNKGHVGIVWMKTKSDPLLRSVCLWVLKWASGKDSAPSMG